MKRQSNERIAFVFQFKDRFMLSYLKVLGEYSYTLSELDPQVILQELFSLMERKFEGNIIKQLASNQMNPWYD